MAWMSRQPFVRRDSDLGKCVYLAGMNLAGRYAYAGREYVATSRREEDPLGQD